MTNAKLSLQLYTVRDALAADLPGTLERVAGLGFRNVEAFGFVGRAAEFRAAYDAAGLRAPSAHASFLSDQLTPDSAVADVPTIEHVLDEAATLGVEILIDPFVPAAKWRDAADIARTAELLNSYADVAAARGIRLGYHNHSHEFHHTVDGVPALAYFAGLLDERVVLEVDVFWAAIGRQDVAALLGALGDRVRLLHAKDGIIGADPFHPDTQGTVTLDQRPAGQGDLDMPALLEVPPHLEFAVVEFDEFAGDLFGAVGESAEFLKGCGVRA